MKNSSVKTTKGGLTVKSGINAGGLSVANHNRRTLKVRSGVKAGSLAMNHNRGALTARA